LRLAGIGLRYEFKALRLKTAMIFLAESRLAVQAVPPIPTHSSVALSVCMFVVCHSRASA